MCLHNIFPFSKSYPEIKLKASVSEIESQLQNAGKVFWQSFDTCAMLFHQNQSFSPKSKTTNAFVKYILKLKACGQSIQAKNKLFSHVIVNNYLCNDSFIEFLIKIELVEAQNQSRHPSWLYCTVVGLSELAIRSCS